LPTGRRAKFSAARDCALSTEHFDQHDNCKVTGGNQPCILAGVNMNKSASRKSTINLKGDGIYLVGVSGEETKIAEPITVTAFGTSDPGSDKEQAFTEVRFKDRAGTWKRKIIPSSMLSAQRRDFIRLLADSGYSWPALESLWSLIVGALSSATPKKHISIVFVPGWHKRTGKAFVLPHKTYADEKADRKAFRLRPASTVLLGQFRVRGELADWQKKIGKKCWLSSRARVAISAAFAAPNLRPLNIDSFGLNFSGETSSGKGLLTRLPASVVGLNESGGPATWDCSPTGVEQRALGHRDCLLPLDDLSHADGSADQIRQMTKLVTFRLAGNRSKTRAGQYIHANQLINEDWRVITISTSEDEFWKHQTGAIRGEEVRMINIRACASDMKDIFDGSDASKVVGCTLNERIAFVEQQGGLCLELQGTPFDHYLKRRLRDNAAERTLKGYMTEFCHAAPLQEGARALGRIRRCFAVMYASAALAIDYQILPWKKKPTLRDIKACFDDAIDQLTTATSSVKVAAKEEEEALIHEFRTRVSNAKFIGRAGATARQLRSAAGMRQRNKHGNVEYLLFAHVMNEWFPDVTTRQRLAAALAVRGLLKAGRRKDTRTVQTKLAALNRKVCCYKIRRDKILEHGNAS
jgi:hypothetical protein